HTNASWCAAAEMSVAAVAVAAHAAGLARIGLSDHLWLDPRRGSRPAVTRILALRETLARLATPVDLALGAEADCAPGLGIAGGDGLAALDFVVAADHFSDLRQGAAPWPRTSEELAARLAEGLRAIMAAPATTHAGHPFYLPARVLRQMPWLFPGRVPTGLGLTPDRMAEVLRLALPLATPALELAARRGVRIELNAKALGPRSRPLLLPFFRRAREIGCAFACASDAHRLAEVGRHRALAGYAREIGL
ncbi:MAG: hypothetical protein AAB368_08955, partial [bacterium]